MELPKNVTQIGEPGQDPKVYIEDYVISYMKLLGEKAREKKMAVALYGKCSREKDSVYYFIYGGHTLNSITDQVSHLSSAQLQEIEHLRRIYFPGLSFLGYCMVNGELVDSIMVWEQEICHQVQGYAQFYEKNDTMLEILLTVKPKEEGREVLDESKYEMVKKRRKERKAENEREEQQKREESIKTYRFAQLGTVAMFALVCIGGTYLMAQAAGVNLKETVSDYVVNLLAKSAGAAGQESGQDPEDEILPALTRDLTGDSQNLTGNLQNQAGGSQSLTGGTKDLTLTEVGTIVTEDALTAALLEENRKGTEPPGDGQAAETAGNRWSSTENEQAGDRTDSPGQEQWVSAGDGQAAETAGNRWSSTENGEAGDSTGNPEKEQWVSAGDGQAAETTGNRWSSTENGQAGDSTDRPGNEQWADAGDGQAVETTGQATGNPEVSGIDLAEGSLGNLEETTGSGQTITENSAGGSGVAAVNGDAVAAQPNYYVIRKGDTLIGISVREYGNSSYVDRICQLNHIQNPDNIQMGQKILLP